MPTTHDKIIEITEEQDKVLLTRGAKEIIKEAIFTTKSLEPNVICAQVAEIMVKKFDSKINNNGPDINNNYENTMLDYQASRMKMRTTLEMLNAINSFLNPQRKRRGIDFTKFQQ